MCAVCHVNFPYPYSPKMIWCKKDEFYVCRRCWETDCKERHDTSNQNKGTPMMVVAIASLFLLLVTLPCGLVSLYDPLVTIQWNGMPVSDIGSLPSGGIVKVEGSLISNLPVALGGYEVNGKRGYSWIWNTDNSFHIDDGTGNIRVVTQDYYDIAPGSHRAPNAVHTDGTAYFVGDNVTIVGIVHMESGSKVLHLLFIGPGKATKAFEPWIFLFTILTLASSIYVIARIGLLTHHRNSRHMEAIRNAIPSGLPEDQSYKPDGLEWLSSPQFITRSSSISLGICVIALAMILFALLWIFYIPREKWDFIFYPLFNGFVADLALGGILITDMRFEKPPEIGLTKTGIYFWHDSSYIRLTSPYFIDWAEIKSIGHPNNNSQQWLLKRNNKEEISLNNLDPSVINQMKTGWDNWKTKQAKIELGKGIDNQEA